jgi:hypothetical protein
MKGKMKLAGIPTTFDHINFRSRLEAHWAAFFTLIGWEWEYEPFDLSGYIPDFLLKFPHAPMLAEVKPLVTLDLEECRGAITKIKNSGWRNEAIIVGSSLFEGCGELLFNPLHIGHILERVYGGSDADPNRVEWENDLADIGYCSSCDKITVHSSNLSWMCRYAGCTHKRVDSWSPESRSLVRLKWASAKNSVQWESRKGGLESINGILGRIFPAHMKRS